MGKKLNYAAMEKDITDLIYTFHIDFWPSMVSKESHTAIEEIKSIGITNWAEEYLSIPPKKYDTVRKPIILINPNLRR